jgi:Ca-activated chloride channel family protein
MSFRRLTSILALAIGALVVTVQGRADVWSQAPAAAASIDGRVVDASLTGVPGVQVTLRQGATTVATTTSDATGAFTFARVQPGAYTIRATATGFKTSVAPIVVRGVGPIRVSIAMQPGARQEEVRVTATPAPPPAQAAANESVADAKMTQGGRGGNMAGRAIVGGAMPMAAPAYPGHAFRQQPYETNTEAYARIEHNRFKLTSADPLSTFAADVDTASYTNVRRFLNDGALPPTDAVRVEEFINYFHYRYPEPEGDRPVSITTEVGDAPWAPGHKLVLVGLRAKPIDQREVGGRNIVLLIDVSGSMQSADKLPLVKTGLRMFVDNLRDDDRIAIVVYAGASGLVLPSTPARHRDRIHDAIEGLHAGGSTNGGQGLMLAYKVAQDSFVRGGINRVILASDGDFNVGITGQGPLLDLIEEKKRSGIFLSVLGVGTGNLKDQTMEMLADKGNGHYSYLDSLHEARRVLVREGGATLETVAKDVKLQVEFNPAAVRAWKLVGYENRLLAHQDFNDDKKDGGEMGAGHTVTALYEIVPAGAALPAELDGTDGRPSVDPLVYQSDRRPTGQSAGELMTVKVRYKQPAEDVSNLMSQAVRAGGQTRELPFAAAVAEFGLLLREKDAPLARWDGLLARLSKLPVPAEDAAERQGLREVVELAVGLRKLHR